MKLSGDIGIVCDTKAIFSKSAMGPEPGFQVFGHPHACKCHKIIDMRPLCSILGNIGASWVHLGISGDHLFASSGLSCNQDALEKLWNINKHNFSLNFSLLLGFNWGAYWNLWWLSWALLGPHFERSLANSGCYLALP